MGRKTGKGGKSEHGKESLQPWVHGAGTEAEEIVHVDLQSAPDVYSYFMFVEPTNRKREGSSWTIDGYMGYLLITINFVFQGVLLYAVFNRVVLATENWRSGITDEQLGIIGASPWAFVAPSGGCNDGASLCVKREDLSCSPPSVQLTSRWDELDLDGDGVWTMEEAVEAQDSVKCKYTVDSVEIFNVFRSMVLNREGIIWVHPELKDSKAIRKPYFDYAAGDIIMCGYRDDNMCGNIMKRGFLDAAIEHGTAPRVGNTTDSAMAYCRGLLEPGGYCDTQLPSTYAVWKIGSAQECGDPDFSSFVHEHPGTHERKSLLSVDYSARQDFEMVMTPLFQSCLFIVLFLWLFSMVFEFKGIVIVLTWIYDYPCASEFGALHENDAVEECLDDDGQKTYRILGIDPFHRGLVGSVTLLRVFFLFVLAYTGVGLLLKSQSYMGLVMDAISLVFILETAAFLHAQVLRPDIQAHVEDVKPMTVRQAGHKELHKYPALRDLLWVVGVVGTVCLVMWAHTAYTTSAMEVALKCSCLKEGQQCREAAVFNADFWHHYWKVETPQIFADVDKLRAGVDAEGAEGDSSSSATLLHASRSASVTSHRHVHRRSHISGPYSAPMADESGSAGPDRKDAQARDHPFTRNVAWGADKQKRRLRNNAWVHGPWEHA